MGRLFAGVGSPPRESVPALPPRGMEEAARRPRDARGALPRQVLANGPTPLGLCPCGSSRVRSLAPHPLASPGAPLHQGPGTLDEAPRVLTAALADRRLRLAGVLTHFADATGDEETARRQHDLLGAFVTELPGNCLVHEANTVAALRWPWTHRGMVRVGLAWTGCLPAALAEQAGFEPTVSWRARIAHVRSVRAGDRVGYGGHWSAPCDGVVAVVPVGYADGYPIGVGCTGSDSCAHVDVLDDDGRAIGAAPVIGVVNMDQFLIDVTEITSRGARVQEGQGVSLLSDDPGSAASPLRLAQHARCVPHAMLCRVHPDVPRIYTAAASGQVVTSTARCALAG